MMNEAAKMNRQDAWGLAAVVVVPVFVAVSVLLGKIYVTEYALVLGVMEADLAVSWWEYAIFAWEFTIFVAYVSFTMTFLIGFSEKMEIPIESRKCRILGVLLVGVGFGSIIWQFYQGEDLWFALVLSWSSLIFGMFFLIGTGDSENDADNWRSHPLCVAMKFIVVPALVLLALVFMSESFAAAGAANVRDRAPNVRVFTEDGEFQSACGNESCGYRMVLRGRTFMYFLPLDEAGSSAPGMIAIPVSRVKRVEYFGK